MNKSYSGSRFLSTNFDLTLGAYVLLVRICGYPRFIEVAYYWQEIHRNKISIRLIRS